MKFWVLVFSMAVYCIAIVTIDVDMLHTSYTNQHTSSAQKILSDLTGPLFYHTAQSESSAANYNNLPAPSQQNDYTDFWNHINARERLLQSAYFQYLFLATNRLINHRKSDLIFPFHYFW